MSRVNDDDDYENTRKNIEFFSDEEEFQDDDYVEPVYIEKYEQTDNIYKLTQILKEYAKSECLPLCEYLNHGLLEDFFEQ